MEAPAAAMQQLETDDNLEPHGQDQEMTSVVSYPHRCSAWGDNRYRGNCDGRLFKDLVLRYGSMRVADPMMGSGTTRDVIHGLNRSRAEHVDYWGGDLREGFDLCTMPLPGVFDFVWVHPPYWNIVRYGKHRNDLSNCETYPRFTEMLSFCLEVCYQALSSGGRLAVLVGDVRRQGVYYPIVRDVLSLEGRLGSVRSVIIKVQHNCTSDRRAYGRMEDVPIKHEYCVVFKK